MLVSGYESYSYIKDLRGPDQYHLYVPIVDCLPACLLVSTNDLGMRLGMGLLVRESLDCLLPVAFSSGYQSMGTIKALTSASRLCLESGICGLKWMPR